MSANTRENRDAISKLDLLPFVHAVVAEMPGWQIVERAQDSDPVTSVRVRHASGAMFYVHRSTWPPELNVGAIWPRAGDTPTGDEFRPREGGPYISVSPWRDPKVLARDITRRFAVPFLPLWTACAKERDEAGRRAESSHLLAQRLALTLREELRDYSEGWRIYAAGCEVRVTRWGTVYFERLSTDADKPERAAELATLLASWREPEPDQEATL